MQVLSVILGAFLVQIFTGVFFDIIIDMLVIAGLWVWVKFPSKLPTWMRSKT